MPRSIFRGIVRDIGIVGLANIGNSLSGILLLPLLTRTLGLQEYGLYVQFIVTISLVMAFATLGLPYATVRFLSGEKDKRQIQDDVYSTLTFIALFGAAVGIIFLILAGFTSKILFDGFTNIVYILSILIPVECVLSSLVNLLRAFQETKKYAIISLIKTYVELVAIYIVVINGYGIIYVALSIFIFRAALLIILIAGIIRTVGVCWPRFSRIREYLSFGLPTVPGGLAAWIVGSSDRYLIGILLGTTYVGYYNPAYSLGSMIIMLMTPINFVLVSVLAKHYDDNRMDLVQSIFKYSLKYFLILAIPASLGISLLSKPLLEMLSTKDIARESYMVTPLIAFGMLLFSSGAGIINFSLYLAKKTKILMINWILAASVNLALNLVFIPKWGIIGAALATALAYAIGFIYSIYFSTKYFKLSFDAFSLIKIVISSVIMAFFIIIFYPSSPCHVILVIAISIFIYFISLIAIKGICAEEISFIMNLPKGRY